MNSDHKIENSQFPLSQLKKGQNAKILRVSGSGPIKRRMMDMGMVPGSEIKLIRKAPFGDPIEFRIKGYSLSLRKEEAETILIELI